MLEYCGQPLLIVSACAQAGSASGSSAGSSGGSSGTGTLERDLVGSGAAPGDGALFSPTNHFLDFSFKNLELLGERNREAAQAMVGLCADPASAPPGEAAAGSSQDLGSEPSACFDPEAGLEVGSSGEGLDAGARVQPGRGTDTGADPLSAALAAGRPALRLLPAQRLGPREWVGDLRNRALQAGLQTGGTCWRVRNAVRRDRWTTLWCVVLLSIRTQGCCQSLQDVFRFSPEARCMCGDFSLQACPELPACPS